MQSIFQFRYEQDTYFLNSEILLIIPLLYLLESIKVHKKLIFLLIIIISLNNINTLNLIKFNNSKSYCGSILNDPDFTEYYDDWTNAFPKKVVLNFCKDKF